MDDDLLDAMRCDELSGDRVDVRENSERFCEVCAYVFVNRGVHGYS